MKKIISLLLAFVVVFAITGCANNPANNGENGNRDVIEGTELTLLKDEISADGKLIGVAYLGWLEGDMETACKDLAGLDYTKDFPFIKDISKTAENDGYRMYLIVPADESVAISVSECAFDENYLPCAGEKLVESNEAILVRGNVSDTIPNLYIIAEKGNEKVYYTPVQSGMDGRLENNENLVYDFTPYDLLPEFTAFDQVPDMVFCGDWTCLTNDGNGEDRTLHLTLESDGGVKYTYGIGNSEVIEQFEGSWSIENDILKFELVGVSLEDKTDARDCTASFEWDITAQGLTLKHIDGDEIIYGTKGKTFDFVANEY